MTIRFCFFCGHGFNSDRWYEPFDCSICGASFMPPSAMKEPQLTLEEAQAAFDKIPLTDKKAVQASKRKEISSLTDKK